MAINWTLGEYFQYNFGHCAPQVRPQDVYIGSLFGLFEALDAGITSVLDYNHNINSPDYADAAIKAHQDSGGRTVFAYGTPGKGFYDWWMQSDLRQSEDMKRVRTQYSSSSDQLLSFAMACRGADFTTIEATRQDFRLARDLDLMITIHVGVGAKRPKGILAMHEAGLLGPDILHVHCNRCTDVELQLISDCGGNTSITPETEMQMACGMPITGKLLGRNIQPSLGRSSSKHEMSSGLPR